MLWVLGDILWLGELLILELISRRNFLIFRASSELLFHVYLNQPQAPVAEDDEIKDIELILNTESVSGWSNLLV